jgi:hypothetical protein
MYYIPLSAAILKPAARTGSYLMIKSLLSSLCQREVSCPSLAKRGEGRFNVDDI